VSASLTISEQQAATPANTRDSDRPATRPIMATPAARLGGPTVPGHRASGQLALIP
jgi:hypothetical protein